jgi:hypothetical protein
MPMATLIPFRERIVNAVSLVRGRPGTIRRPSQVIGCDRTGFRMTLILAVAVITLDDSIQIDTTIDLTNFVRNEVSF